MIVYFLCKYDAMWIVFEGVIFYILWSKLPFWSLRFGQFCHFSPNLKPFASGYLWFQFCCHFGPKINQLIFLKFNHDVLSNSKGLRFGLK
ncbi:hypothetical protein Hanom_Chr06g00501201 [Helianthus anomalus]